MIIEKLIVGTLLTGIGVIFITKNKALGEGMAEFYKKLYTKEKMPFMFKAAGTICMVGGLIIAITAL